VRIEAVPERIDHQTLRLLWAKSGRERRLFWVFSARGKRVLSWPGGSLELDSADLSEGGGAGNAKLRPLKVTMPGKVVAVKVREGDLVEAEQGLVIVEAMKMENLLLAAARARVAKVHVSAGDRLESGAVLITFEEA
jgi:biotin carboxyl carrier protein